jgi:cephalosporin hydroxylase
MSDDSAEVVRKFHQLYYNQPQRTWQNTFWLGTNVSKTPLDLWIYQELVYDLRPDLIVECGTAAGGSALFLASVCDLVDHGRVLTIDIEAKPRPKHARIQYVTGSSTAKEMIGTVKNAAVDAQKVLVILDSDHRRDHVLGELRGYADVVTSGSYLIVEDGNINGHPVYADYGPGPMEAITQFLTERNDFAVDESREKFFLTFNPRGYLKKR